MTRFLSLKRASREEALQVAAAASGRPDYLLEKDAWVVWALETLYACDFGQYLTFKGGTSLSKGYGLIRRFSDDVDLTYDIRKLAPDLVKDRDDAMPGSRSEADRWSKIIRTERLPAFVASEVTPALEDAVASARLSVNIRAEGSDTVYLEYEAATSANAYVRQHVKLEFGARGTGEPHQTRPVRCDAEGFVEGVSFPAATPRLMLPERTFWEKATAIHVFCRQGLPKADRVARHWYDIVRLDDAGIVDGAINDPQLALDVATHKSWFFREKDSNGSVVDYREAIKGSLQLLPDDDCIFRLKGDFEAMLEAGQFFDDVIEFDSLMTRCIEIQAKVNKLR